MSERRLIVNADDLGYSRGVNMAIARCAREGALGSATIMAGGRAFDHAVELLKDLPELGVGVHLTLTELDPVTPASGIPELVARSGAMHPTLQALYPRLVAQRAARDSLRRELCGQLEKVLKRGILPTHVDSHKHLHAFPLILDAVVEAAKRYGVGWIRNPFDATPFWTVASVLHPTDRRTFYNQALPARALRVFKPYFKARLARARLASVPHFYGTALTGVWNEESLLSLMNRLPAGVSELMFHPGDYDAELRAGRTRLLEQRERERDLLLSDCFRETIRSHRISLIHYGKVVP